MIPTLHHEELTALPILIASLGGLICFLRSWFRSIFKK